MSVQTGGVRLELTWVGKYSTPRLEPRILREDASRSYCSERCSEFSDNLLIHGDNLLALKALEHGFAGRVKCVFIDPPYNTGSAFAQYDDRVEHSLWLSMMRDRLAVMWRLLSQDGSIWMSVDDQESHYLKVLCDEVFGRQRFVSNVIWQKKYTVANDARWLSDNHDHILVYCKDETRWLPNRLPRSSEMNARYKNPDDHPKGPWKATPLHAKSGSEASGKFEYTFLNGVVWKPPPGTYSRYSADSLARMDAGREIWFGTDGRATPARKTFLCDLKNEGVPALTVWTHEEVGHNHEAKEEARSFNAENVFATPKPERLIHRILHIATNPGDLVLDSFAGSGTTGAVAHKMGRRWIMVELGEHCDTHIVPRLRKVIDGADPGGVTEATGWRGGGGFRYCTLAPSLLDKDDRGNPIISKEYNAAMLAEAICVHEGFVYAPSREHYWLHGVHRDSANTFLWVTTQTLTRERLERLSTEIGEGCHLMVSCLAFKGDPGGFPNLVVKKLPTSILDRCEWGKDDYSLKIAALGAAPAPEPEPAAADDAAPAATAAPAAAKKKGKKSKEPAPEGQGSLFDGGDKKGG